MNRLEPSREQVLFALLDLMRDGALPSGGRFLAAEVRTMGRVLLLLAAHGSSTQQAKLEGYLFSDLRALARAGLLEVDPHGRSLDVSSCALRTTTPTNIARRKTPGPRRPPERGADAPQAPAAKAGPGFTYDAVISHAHADKDRVARPLAEELRRLGFTVV